MLDSNIIFENKVPPKAAKGCILISFTLTESAIFFFFFFFAVSAKRSFEYYRNKSLVADASQVCVCVCVCVCVRACARARVCIFIYKFANLGNNSGNIPFDTCKFINYFSSVSARL